MADDDITGEEWEYIDERFEKERLHRAVQHGDVAEIKRLLTAGEPIDGFDELAKTPLHYAAEAGNLAMMRLLIDAGADVNAHDKSRIGNTVLREVAGNCTYAVAEMLIEAGADPTIPGWMQATGLQQAQKRKRTEGLRVAELLEDAARNPGKYRKRGRRK